nr:VOC family protein [Microtetraspora sp. NBRC 16547]
MRVKAFDHLVLNVRDVERALGFYCGLLGLEPVRVAEWRAGDAPFPSAWIHRVISCDRFLVQFGREGRFTRRSAVSGHERAAARGSQPVHMSTGLGGGRFVRLRARARVTVGSWWCGQ